MDGEDGLEQEDDEDEEKEFNKLGRKKERDKSVEKHGN
jgi:hypothetical protein